MTFRQALPADIPEIQVVRHAVKENVLSDPALVTDEDCLDFLTRRGRGWVCENEGRILGFSIVDLQDNNVWALFLRPESEGLGIGKMLHRLLLDWYFSQTDADIWLGTSPNTRAEGFYRKYGWRETGRRSNGEIRFEMSYVEFQQMTLPDSGL